MMRFGLCNVVAMITENCIQHIRQLQNIKVNQL